MKNRNRPPTSALRVPSHPVHCIHSITAMLYSLPTLILTVLSLPVSPCPPPGLPCKCPDRFVPVCASNGRTYPSACVARCMGFKDHQFVFGQCRLSNPCANKPCQRNQRWVQLHSWCSCCLLWSPTHEEQTEGSIDHFNIFSALN